jgi:hypothetical protein
MKRDVVMDIVIIMAMIIVDDRFKFLKIALETYVKKIVLIPLDLEIICALLSLS